MTIQELMEKRAKVWEAAKNFVDTHENENGVLSAEDSATYERMESEIEDLTKAIDRHRKAEEMEKNLNQPVNQPLTGKPYAGGQTGYLCDHKYRNLPSRKSRRPRWCAQSQNRDL